jgi:hypothetical protein
MKAGPNNTKELHNLDSSPNTIKVIKSRMTQAAKGCEKSSQNFSRKTRREEYLGDRRGRDDKE